MIGHEDEVAGGALLTGIGLVALGVALSRTSADVAAPEFAAPIRP